MNISFRHEREQFEHLGFIFRGDASSKVRDVAE